MPLDEARKKRLFWALEKISPPYDDAEKFLNETELDQFLDALVGAAIAYLQMDEKAERLIRSRLLQP